MNLAIKICGMREADNIISAISLEPDILGFIFYSKSPRYATGILNPQIMASIPSGVRKAGVFVNADLDEITETAEKYSLDTIQLHGNELPGLCKKLRDRGMTVIKVFNFSSSSDFGICAGYTEVTDYFLFDTLTDKHGGSGRKFAWEIIDRYDLDHPFFLSGGIGPGDCEKVTRITNPYFYGVDLNSRFEIKPGLKDIEKIRTFIYKLRS